jgi:hypothetical protein
VALKQLRKTARKGSTAGAGARVRQGVLVHARTPLGILNELQLAITDPAYFGDNAAVLNPSLCTAVCGWEDRRADRESKTGTRTYLPTFF